MQRFLGIFCVLILAFSTQTAFGQKQLTAWTGARIYTADGKIFDPGVLLIRNGKIQAVGNAADVKVPADAVVNKLPGRVIIPGLVDSHSHLGVYSRPSVRANSDGNEMTGPVQSLVRALDSLNPFDPGIRMANAGGVTTANIMPGSGNVIGGQTIYVKLRGYSPEQMWIDAEHAVGGLKMANGENPKRSYGSKKQAPGTRMKVAALQRAEFIKAQQYQQKWTTWREKRKTDASATPPDRDLGLDALVEVLEKKRTVHFHTHRADDILTVLRLKKEFGFDLVIQHGTEAYKVLDEIAAAKVSVSMTVVDSPGGKQEVVDLIEECGAELHRRGVPVLINTDDPITESRFFLRTAATAVRGGLSEEAALQSITLKAAQAMHLGDRVGSLAVGKDADFVVLSGRPFSVYTRVLQTYIDGQQVFDLNDERQRLFQTGGFQLTDPRLIPEALPMLQVDKQPLEKKAVADQRLPADATEFVVRGERVYPVSGDVIEDGVVHVKDGRIAFVGSAAGFKLPDGVPVLRATAVTPGLIDAHSVVPLNGEYNIPADQDADETSDPNQADVRVLDGFHPAEPLLRYLLEQGVTTVHACPGRDNAIAGQTGVFRTHGNNVETMALNADFAMVFNLGESPKQTYDGKRPRTRMGTAALIREALIKARTHRDKLTAAGKDLSKRPDRDLRSESLGKLLARKRKAVFVAHRADDILTALRLIEEFQLDGILAAGTEAYLVTDAIQKAKVPVIVHPTMQRVGGLETINTYMGNAAVLANRDVPLAISSGVEGYVPKTRVARYEAAMAAVYGLNTDRALRAVTLGPAEILGIADRVGSLQAGKHADLVLYDGDPFEHATHVTHVTVNGKLVYDRASRPPLSLIGRRFLSTPEPGCCLGY